MTDTHELSAEEKAVLYRHLEKFKKDAQQWKTTLYLLLGIVVFQLLSVY